jgi:hypothetical protein
MIGIDNATSSGSRPTIDAPGTAQFWTNGDPGMSIAATILEADWHNDVQEILLAVIAAGGVTPTKGPGGDNDLLVAIRALAGAEVPQSSLVGRLFRSSASVMHLRPSSGADVVVGIDNVILKNTGNIVFDMASDLEGSELPSTAYYLYLRDLAGVLDPQISATVPDLDGGTKPGYKSGDVTRRCVGSFWNDVGEDITPTIWGPGGEVLFTAHDADHVHNLIEAESTSWRNEVVNIPITASGVLISASAETPTDPGGVFFAVGDATGTIPDTGQDPGAAGLENSLLHAINAGTGDTKGLSMHGEIPITIPATPAVAYVSTFNLGSDFFMIVRGYRDLYAPR